MKKVLEIMALALVALPLIGGNIKVEYSGPSGQGDMIFKAKATGTTNLAMGDDGIYNVTVDPNYPISGMGPGSLEITNKYMIIGNAAGAGEASSPSAVRTNLDLEIGTDVQAWDAQLDTWATVTPTVDGQALVAATDYAEMRTNLDLVVGTDVLAPGGDLTGQINSIAVATVTDGAAAGATALQPGVITFGFEVTTDTATVYVTNALASATTMVGTWSKSAAGAADAADLTSVAVDGSSLLLSAAGSATPLFTCGSDGKTTFTIVAANDSTNYLNIVQRDGAIVSTTAIEIDVP